MSEATNRSPEPESIIQPWAAALGLRHQGVLVSAIRGPDTERREDVSKYLTRVLRGAVLRPHCKDLRKAASYMLPLDEEQWDHSSTDFLRGFDHYPLHWFTHFMHACEIIGYKHPDYAYRRCFGTLYFGMTRKLHLPHESEKELDEAVKPQRAGFRESAGDTMSEVDKTGAQPSSNLTIIIVFVLHRWSHRRPIK